MKASLTVALLALALLMLHGRAGFRGESLVYDSGALLAFASGELPATDSDFIRLKGILEGQSLPQGHSWITEAVRDASPPQGAPWRNLAGRTPAPEAVADDLYPVLLARARGMLGVVAVGCGSLPSDFEVHLTGGRGISVYSMADGSIYLSHAAAASLDDDELAFALAHEIRHLRACHYRLEGGLSWVLEEPHREAFEKLAEAGFIHLIEPAEDYYSQESECDAYAAFMAAYCGFDPEAGCRLIDRLPEGDGRLFPLREKRKADLDRLTGSFYEGRFAELYLPGLHLADALRLILGSDGGGQGESEALGFASRVLLRDAAALDLLMRQNPEDGAEPKPFPGLFDVKLGTRVEAASRNMITVDVALFIRSAGISGMSPAAVSLRCAMIRCEGGWRLASSFETPGRLTAWNSWTYAEDKLPYAKPSEDGDMKYAIDALSAWKASFTLDPALHILCYSQSGVQPYFENGGPGNDALDLIALSELFSSLQAGSEMRIFDITASKPGRGFVVVGFGYTLLAGDFPVLAGRCRMGMVPERGGWAVAGVSLY